MSGDKWTCTECGAEFDQPTLHAHGVKLPDPAQELREAVREWVEAEAKAGSGKNRDEHYDNVARYKAACRNLRRLVGMEEG